MTEKFPVIVFADGASSGNPGPGGWGSIIATPDGKVVELGGGDPQTTNNRMELMATIKALEAPESQGQPVAVYTDSVYVIRGITQWIWGWRKNGWKTADGKDVTNQELWKRLSAALATREKSAKVDWHFVRGHSGIPGNERVDQIAVAFSKGQSIRLFRGPLLEYTIAIHDIPADTSLPEMRPRTEEKVKPLGYLSLVGATAMRHSDWTSCEKRVKGVSGAKFKKVMSAQEEAQVLRSWGVDPASVCCKKS
ncbi:MAG: ribonuclease HI [Bdellovibrionia bacterium]